MLCFSYYLLCFFFNKTSKEGGTGSAQKWGWEGGPMYTHVGKCKNDKKKE
jgi:hypothetical protein